MDELFDTSKTNWLELESDPAKTTNAALEELQKKNAEMFQMAIAEAKRVEEKKSRQYTQLAQLIGQGVKTVKDIQNYKDQSDKLDAARNKLEKAPKEVNPEDEDDDNETETKINKAANVQEYNKNTERNASDNNEKGALSDGDLKDILQTTPYEQIKKNWGTASLFFEDNYATYIRQVENDPVLLEGHPENTAPGSNGKWTIREAEALGGPEGRRIANDIRWFYKKAFFMSPELKDLNKRHSNKLIKRMLDYDQKDRAAKLAALTTASKELHKENRIKNLETCINDGGGISCLVGTKENPNSGHVWLNEGRIDGTKDNAQGWKISLEDLDFLANNDRITPEQLIAIAKGKVPLRGAGGKEIYMNEVNNLGEYEEQILRLADKLGQKRFKEENAKKKILSSEINKVAITKLLDDKQNGVRIDNEYIDNALTNIHKELHDKGIFMSKEEIRAMDNSIDKYNTWEEVSDEKITEHIDQLIENKIAIPDADSMLVHIDDPELFKKYTKKLDEHRVRLSFVSKEDAKKFNGDILPEINAYLQITQTTTLKTPLKRNLIDNSLKLFKSKVAATQDKLGLEKAKELAFDEIQAEIANATEKGIDLPGKYTDRPRVKIDRDAQILRLSTEKYIDNTPNALTDNKPWDYETPEIIQQRKDYLAGKAAPPIEDIVISNKFPNHTYHSVIETRVAIDPKDDKEGFEGNPADTEEQKAKINNADKLTNKPTPTRTFTALTSNDINQVLTIARKTDDVNSLLHSNLDSTLESPLERLGFDRPLSELSVDEIRGLVADESFHGFSDAQFGIFGIRGNQLKTILERESIDGDRLFDEDLQNELAIYNIRYKANQANSLSTISSENTRLTNISRGEQQEFLEIMGILSGDKDSKEIEKTAEWQFLNSPFNQLDVLLPAVQTEVMNIDPSTSTGIDWKGVGFPFVGIYQGMNERWKKSGEAIKERGKEVRQQRVEQEQKFPTK